MGAQHFYSTQNNTPTRVVTMALPERNSANSFVQTYRPPRKEDELPVHPATSRGRRGTQQDPDRQRREIPPVLRWLEGRPSPLPRTCPVGSGIVSFVVGRSVGCRRLAQTLYQEDTKFMVFWPSSAPRTPQSSLPCSSLLGADHCTRRRHAKLRAKARQYPDSTPRYIRS